MTSTAHLDFDVDLQCISGRKYILCDHLKSKYETQELIMSCPDCSYFFARCCSTNKHQQTRPCHHFRLIFTDGACKDNGKAGATAGMGIAFGQTPEQQFSLPVDDAVDLNARRSNQRAELLAALEGLRLLVHMGKVSTPHERVYNRHGTGGGVDRKAKWVITTDSEYVVKGMTDWLPNKWKRNGMRTTAGRTPLNLDLFMKLDQEIDAIERERDVQIGFWHVLRKHNVIADRLATAAALNAPPYIPPMPGSDISTAS